MLGRWRMSVGTRTVEHVAHVGFRRHAEKGDRRARTEAPAHVRHEPVAEVRIAGLTGSQLLYQLLEVLARAPSPSRLLRPLPPFRLGRRPRVVQPAKPPWLRIEENESGRALGVGRGEQNGQSASLVRAPEDGLLGARLVHDCAEIVHAGLEGRQGGRPVGKPCTPLVEHEHACERGQAEDVPQKERLIPCREQVSREAADEHDVDRPLPHDLVGDRDLAAAGVANVGYIHRGKSPI